MKLNFENPQELKNQILELKPKEGICIFIDICGSTAIKKKELKEWILLIGNTIYMCSGVSQLFRKNVIKLIGDEIMIYIPNNKIIEANENFATVLELLKTCISSNPIYKNITLPLKAAIHYCTDSYNITYNDNNDYYGNDIDLTARLMKKTYENKIVMSETFYQIVNSIESSFLKNSTDKIEDEFKGIDKKVGFRVISFS